MSVTSFQAGDGVRSAVPADDVDDVDLRSSSASGPGAVVVRDDVHRRVVRVAALAVVAPARVVGAQRVDDVVHELPRAAVLLARVRQRTRIRARHGLHDARAITRERQPAALRIRRAAARARRHTEARRRHPPGAGGGAGGAGVVNDMRVRVRRFLRAVACPARASRTWCCTAARRASSWWCRCRSGTAVTTATVMVLKSADAANVEAIHDAGRAGDGAVA